MKLASIIGKVGGNSATGRTCAIECSMSSIPVPRLATSKRMSCHLVTSVLRLVQAVPLDAPGVGRGSVESYQLSNPQRGTKIYSFQNDKFWERWKLAIGCPSNFGTRLGGSLASKRVSKLKLSWEQESIHRPAPVRNFSLPKKRISVVDMVSLFFIGFLYLPPAWKVSL